MTNLTQIMPHTFARRKDIGDVVEIIGYPIKDSAPPYLMVVEVRLPSDGMVTYWANVEELNLILESEAYDHTN